MNAFGAVARKIGAPVFDGDPQNVGPRLLRVSCVFCGSRMRGNDEDSGNAEKAKQQSISSGHALAVRFQVRAVVMGLLYQTG